MTTTADIHVDRAPGPAETRIASYLLVEYLERLGRRGRLRAVRAHRHRVPRCAGKEPHPVRQHAPRAGGRPCRGRLRAGRAQAGRAPHPPGPGTDQRGHGRGQRRPGLHPDGRHRRRRAVPLLRPPSAPGSEPASGRRSVPDLPAVLQAGVPGGPARRTCRARSSARSIWPRPGVRGRSWSTCPWTSSPPTSPSAPSTRCRRRWLARP